MRKILFISLLLLIFNIGFTAPSLNQVYKSINSRDNGVIVEKDGNKYRLVKATKLINQYDVVYCGYSFTDDSWIATNGSVLLPANGVATMGANKGYYLYVQIAGNGWANVYQADGAPTLGFGKRIYLDELVADPISLTLSNLMLDEGSNVIANVTVNQKYSDIYLATATYSRPTNLQFKFYDASLRTYKPKAYLTNSNFVIVNGIM